MRTIGGNGNNYAHASFNGTGGDFTYSGAIIATAWGADFGAPNQFNNMVRVQDYSGNAHALTFGMDNTAGTPRFSMVRQIDDGTTDSGEAIWTWDCALNTAYRWAISYDSSSIANTPTLYLNGVDQGAPVTATQPTALVTSWAVTPGMVLGRNAAARIHHPAVWTRELNAQEMADLTNGITPDFFPTNLVFYAPYLDDADEDVGGGTGVRTGTGGSWAADDFSQFTAPDTCTVDLGTVRHPWYGFRATLDIAESDAPIVADVSGNTGMKFDVPDAVYDNMMADVAAEGVWHIRTDLDPARARDGGTFGGSGPGGTGVTYGPYVTTGLAVDNDVLDAKVDAFMRFRDAVAVEGGIARWTVQIVAWTDSAVHDDPVGDPGQNAVDFIMSALERARTVHGIIPDQIVLVNEPDNDAIRGNNVEVSPTQLARTTRKFFNAIDAVVGQPYRRMRVGYGEKLGLLDNANNSLGVYTNAQYLDALNTEDPTLTDRIYLGFHPYPDGNDTNGLDTIPTTLTTYGISEAQQGEFWFDTDGVVSTSDANTRYRDHIFNQLSRDITLSELFTIGAFPVINAGFRDWGHLVSTADNGWGNQITGYQSADRRAVLYPYVRYLQWGARRVTESFASGANLRGTSWVDHNGDLLVVMEETSGVAQPVVLAGDAVAGGWTAIEEDKGTGMATVDPTAIIMQPNSMSTTRFSSNSSGVGATGSSAITSAAGGGSTVALGDIPGAMDVSSSATLQAILQLLALGTSSTTGSAAMSQSAPVQISAIGSMVVTGQAGSQSVVFLPNATGLSLLAASANVTQTSQGAIEGGGVSTMVDNATLQALYSIVAAGTSSVVGTAAATESQPGVITAAGSSLTVSQADVGSLAALQALGSSSVAGFATFGQVVALAAQGISLVSGTTTLNELRQLVASGTSVVAGTTNIGTIIPIFASGTSTMNQLAAFIERVNAQGVLTVGGTADVVFVGATPVQAITIANIVEIGTPIVLLSDS